MVLKGSPSDSRDRPRHEQHALVVRRLLERVRADGSVVVLPSPDQRDLDRGQPGDRLSPITPSQRLHDVDRATIKREGPAQDMQQTGPTLTRGGKFYEPED